MEKNKNTQQCLHKFKIETEQRYFKYLAVSLLLDWFVVSLSATWIVFYNNCFQTVAISAEFEYSY